MLGANHVHRLASAGGAPAPRRPAARTAMEALMARILYVGTSGTDDPTRAGVPVNFALRAVEAGHGPGNFIGGESTHLEKHEVGSAGGPVGMDATTEWTRNGDQHRGPP